MIDPTALPWAALRQATDARDMQAAIGAVERLRQAAGALVSAPVPTLQPLDLAAIRATMAAAPQGLESAWPALTQAGAVYERGTLSVVAAPTSAGKTTLLLAQALAWLREPTLTGTIVWWSSEMDVMHLLARLVGMMAGESMVEVIEQERAGSLSQQVHDAWREITALAPRIVMVDEPLTADGYKQAVEHLEQTTEILAVIVDYGQEMDPVPPEHPLAARYSRNREQEVAATTVLLAELARRLHIPVVMAAQLNRQIVYAGRKGEYVPDLSHLRESGRIEQRATLVLALRNAEMSRAVAGRGTGAQTKDMIYRAWPDTALVEARAGALAACATQYPERTLVEVFLLKGRIHGGVGNVVPLAMDGKTGRIDQLVWRYASGPVQSGNGGQQSSNGGNATTDVDDDTEPVPGMDHLFAGREPGEDDPEDWLLRPWQ